MCFDVTSDINSKIKANIYVDLLTLVLFYTFKT